MVESAVNDGWMAFSASPSFLAMPLIRLAVALAADLDFLVSFLVSEVELVLEEEEDEDGGAVDDVDDVDDDEDAGVVVVVVVVAEVEVAEVAAAVAEVLGTLVMEVVELEALSRLLPLLLPPLLLRLSDLLDEIGSCVIEAEAGLDLREREEDDEVLGVGSSAA